MQEDKKALYFKNVYDNISSKGYHVTAVLEEKNVTPFAYSTGIFENFNIPELFISGLGPNLSGQIIENYVEKYKSDKIQLNKKIDDLIDTFPIYLIKVKNDDLLEYVLTSVKFYKNKKFEYLQLIFPDLNGKFPNDLSYNYDQNIIGEFQF
ncbi:hypothetical protein HNP37_004028 [Flavobacterium nitrogenifigens]|uniref:DUF4262 domain-containing protein n=2 Tax=Flavobacterium TaxID=237 RepID=A0A7W7J0J6_9FLAO|nr:MULTISPECIES: DUF4262 domain-containing protein [Flavobacterium]MBB4803948.1 hypothetical protein [Flavobacterium nitrogenifigens]MBB6388900.1 hypothetical protein [Flavobacterium notoginsengisoli]